MVVVTVVMEATAPTGEAMAMAFGILLAVTREPQIHHCSSVVSR